MNTVTRVQPLRDGRLFVEMADHQELALALRRAV